MAASELGSVGVAYGFTELLKANLADDLVVVKAQMLAIMNIDLDLEVPADGVEGWSTSPTWVPRDRANCIQVFLDQETEESRFMNQGGPVMERGVIGILWMVCDRDPNMLEVKKQAATRAIKRCIRRRWHADMQTYTIFDVKMTPTDYRFSSMRMQGGSRRGLIGHVTETGDNIDAVIVGVRYLQSVASPTEWT